MSQPKRYSIEFGPLRQFVGDLSRLLAALLPITRLQVSRIKKWPLAPLRVTVFVRHRHGLPNAESLYAVVEALRPGALIVRFHISHPIKSRLIEHPSYFEIYIYDQPIPADVDLKRR